MRTSYSIQGCRFIDEPLSINPDGSITVNFTDTNVPPRRRSCPAQYPQFSLIAKPMSLASSTGGPWLIYYGTVDLSSNLDVIEIKSHVSYWLNSCPSFMRCDGGPQLSGNVKFSNTHHQLCATPLTPSPFTLHLHSVSFMSIYDEHIRIGHTAWINGQIIRRDGSNLHIKTSCIAPCRHIRNSYWASRMDHLNQ